MTPPQFNSANVKVPHAINNVLALPCLVMLIAPISTTDVLEVAQIVLFCLPCDRVFYGFLI
jgi:hypothetical protein